jgi:HSP20 family protein
MNIVRFDPFQEIESLQRDLGRFFDGMSAVRQLRKLEETTWNPHVDISETKDAYKLRVDMPGIPKDQIEVQITGNVLTLKGERKKETEEKGETFFRKERLFGSFYREITLPQNVDADKIKATNKDGVLSIEIPKSEKSKQKLIKVE